MNKHIPNGYKQTEIGIIPKDWEMKKLYEIAEIITGPFGSSIKKEFLSNKGIPIYSARNVLKKDFSKTEFIKTEHYKNLKAFKVKLNDIFITTRGTIGKVRLFNKKKKGIIHSNLSIIRLKQIHKLHLEYLIFILNDKKIHNQINEILSSTTIDALYGSNIKNLLIPLPPLPEQQAIASVLSGMDALIEQLNKLIQKKTAIKKGTMQQLLTGQKRLPGFTGEWVRKKLGEVGIKLKAGGTPSKNIKQYWEGKIPFATIEDLTNSGKYLYSTKNKISEIGLTNSSAWLVPKNSLLISMYASLGEIVINKIETSTNQAILTIIPKKNYDLNFLYYLIRNSKSKYEKLISQTTQKNLNKNKLENLKFLLPPTLKEQQAIAQILSDMDKEIEALEKLKRKYENIKKGAMALLLTGKVRLINSQTAKTPSL